jgi:RND family efflux transporter MFP subunit
VVGGLILCLAVGCGRSAPPPEEKTPPATVTWQGASGVFLKEQTELVGTTMPLPDHAARVSAPVEGRVLSVFGDSASPAVAEGQRVAKGAVLVQLDPTLVKANLAKADAAQEVLRTEEKQAQYAVEWATSEVERLRPLKEEQEKRPRGTGTPLVTAVEWQKAEYNLKDAQSKLKGAQGRLAAGAKEQEALRAQLQLHTLAAPIAGRLGRLQVVPGQTLSVGAAVADVVDLDEQIDVLCYVPPSMVRRLSVGQTARTVPAEGEGEADGEVAYIAEQAEPETGNFAVKVRFDNKDAHLRSNRVLRILVLTRPGKECLSLPESAVSEDEETPTVVVVDGIKKEKNADGKEETVGTAHRLPVELGVRDRLKHQVEIVGVTDPEKDPKKKWQGTVKDAQFVVEGGQGLQTGDKVKLDVGED